MEQVTTAGVLDRVDPAETAYSMRLDWDPDDRIFVVTVPELPGCMTHGETRAEAVRKGEEAIVSWLAAARHWGTPIPAPQVVQNGPDAVVRDEAEVGAITGAMTEARLP